MHSIAASDLIQPVPIEALPFCRRINSITYNIQSAPNIPL